jgi:predicted RNase H-like nuclease
VERRQRRSSKLKAANSRAVAGVDACPGGWIVVQLLPDGTAAVGVVKQFNEVLQLDVAVIAVDIPIETVDESPHEADTTARRFVGARRNSIFSTPIRAVLGSESHAEASRRQRELTGKGLSLQSYWLCRRMLEVNAWVKDDKRIVEIHPEVSFCELRGEPLRFSKHSPEGLAERRALLEQVGITIPRRPPRAKEDDLLDAAAAAWSARRYARGVAEPLPERHTERIGAIWR